MDGYVTIGTELDTKGFDKEIALLESKLSDVESTLQMASEDKTLFSTSEIKEMEAEAQKLGRRIDGLKEKQSKLGQSPSGGILEWLKNAGKETEKNIKKVSRWALAIFGIRSAYMFVRQAMSTLSQYDDQMAVNIEWIRYLLASALKPIIETIINLAYKLLTYINYIAQAWFGVNLFANASRKAFEKQHKSLGGSVKKAKELQKTLAGFDEMNVLQDNKNTGDTGGGAGGASLPSFPKMEDVPIPEWLKWIVDNKNIILDVMAGIAAGLLAWKLGLTGIQSLGIGIAVFGLLFTIQKIIDFIKDPSFNNFLGILKGIAITVAGIAIAVGAWPVAIGAAVALVILMIVKHFDEIMALFDNLIKWLDTNVLGALTTLFGPLGNLLYAPIKWFVDLARTAFKSFYGGIKQVIEGVMKIFKGDFWGGIQQIFGGLLNIMLAPLKGFLSGAWAIIKQVYKFFKDLGGAVGEVVGGAFKTVVNGVLSAIETILNVPIRAVNGLIGIINTVPGITLEKLSTFDLPRLAKGGIVNNPGPGVMMGSYIAGERGPEAVIPLDDQTLDRLGEAFARHTVINASITNTMNGRVLSRELQKVQNSSDFAYNR